MEEIVHLWQLAVMDPYISVEEKEEMRDQLEAWNKKVVMAAKKGFSFFISLTVSFSFGILWC